MLGPPPETVPRYRIAKYKLCVDHRGVGLIVRGVFPEESGISTNIVLHTLVPSVLRGLGMRSTE